MGKIIRHGLTPLLTGAEKDGDATQSSVDQQVKVWKPAYLLWRVDPDGYATAFGAKRDVLLGQTLKQMESAAKTDLDKARVAVDALYQLMQYQVGPEAEKASRESLNRIDQSMRDVDRSRVAAHSEQWMKDSKATFIPPQARGDALEALQALFAEPLQSTFTKKVSQAEIEAHERAGKSLQEWMQTAKITKGADGYAVVQEELPDGTSTRWQLEIFPRLGVSDGYCTVRSLEADGMILTVLLEELAQRLQKQRSKFFAGLTTEARANGELEQAGAKDLAGFDLPKAGLLAHIRVFPKTYDSVMASNLQTAFLLSGAMKQRYGERMAILPMIMEENPRQALFAQIRDAYDTGVRCFNINLFSHGEPSKGLVSSHPPLQPDDLASLANQFPDCQFNIGSIACFGGGLRQGLLDEFARDELIASVEGPSGTDRAALRSRINLFVQSRPNTVNSALLRLKEDRDETYATNYYLSLINGLHAGKTFGEAVRTATEDTRRRTMLHPETILNGKLVFGPSFQNPADAEPSAT